MKGSPSPAFLWPQDVAVKKAGASEFGYVMRKREPRFAKITRYLAREVNPSFKVLSMAGLSYADNFLKLHAEGLCYRDINRDNLFFDPDTGDVRICDNDNVDVDGQLGGILGTGPFMAPEIHRREATPSILTDLYSLSVILFEMFMIHHPLYGQRVEQFAEPGRGRELLLLGTDPLFIFDPDNNDNAPDPALDLNPLAYWPIYPEFLRKQFVRAFTEGLIDPQARVLDREWQKSLARLRDCIFLCPGCGVEVFYDVHRLKASGNLAPCWNCDRVPLAPVRVRVNDHTVMLTAGAELHPHHLDPDRLYDYSRVLGSVSSDGRILSNLDGQTWTVSTLSGGSLPVAPGSAFALVESLTEYGPEYAIAKALRSGLAHGNPHTPAEIYQLWAVLYNLMGQILRAVDLVFGHLAWSGLFGYFIGMAVMRPRSAVKLLTVGYLTAATLHTVWDASDGFNLPLEMAVGLTGYCLMAIAILKARKISPSRKDNFASTMTKMRTVPPSLPVQVEPALVIAGKCFPMRVGLVQMNDVPGLEPAGGDGMVGEFNVNPKDPRMIGLKNLSASVWVRRTGSGEERTIEPGKSVHLTGGSTIHFGAIEGKVR